MSNKLEQALREYQDAVGRAVASQEAQDSEPQEGREKSKSAGYQRGVGAYHSDDVMAAWERYTEAWVEEGTGEWFAPFVGSNNV